MGGVVSTGAILPFVSTVEIWHHLPGVGESVMRRALALETPGRIALQRDGSRIARMDLSVAGLTGWVEFSEAFAQAHESHTAMVARAIAANRL